MIRKKRKREGKKDTLTLVLYITPKPLSSSCYRVERPRTTSALADSKLSPIISNPLFDRIPRLSNLYNRMVLRGSDERVFDLLFDDNSRLRKKTKEMGKFETRAMSFRTREHDRDGTGFIKNRFPLENKTFSIRWVIIYNLLKRRVY